MSFDVHPQLLRSFCAVLDAGSLTAAAAALGFTQSALSKQVASLEEAAGTPLLLRRPRGVEATEAGTRLALRAARILDQLDAVANELRTMTLPLEGSVTLGGFPATAMQLAPVSVARFGLRHPLVEVEFEENSSAVQLRRLRAGRLDLAIVARGDDLPQLVTTGVHVEPLPTGPLLVALPNDHELAGRHRVSPADLAGEAWVVGHGPPGEPQFGAWPTLEADRVAARLSSWSARLGFVAAGLGVTTVPTLVAATLPSGVTTVEVSDPDMPPRELLLVHIGDLSDAAVALHEVLIAEATRIALGAAPTAP